MTKMGTRPLSGGGGGAGPVSSSQRRPGADRGAAYKDWKGSYKDDEVKSFLAVKH